MGNYITHNQITVEPELPFLEAVITMWKEGIGNLIVKDGEEPTCLLTERVILEYLVQEREISNKPMRYIATHLIAKVSPETRLVDAARITVSKKARLLVFENEKLVGMVTSADMLRGFIRTEVDPPLDDVTHTVYKISYDDSLLDAIKLMNEKRVGSLIVIKDEKPYGIFTEGDLLAYVLAIEADLGGLVGHYCSHPIVTAEVGIYGNEATNTMIVKKIKKLPLSEEDNIVGIVSASDMVKAFLMQ